MSKMKKLLTYALATSLFAGPVAAGEYSPSPFSQESINASVEAYMDKNPPKKISAEEIDKIYEKKRFGLLFWSLAGTSVAATVADVESTFRYLKRCRADEEKFLLEYPNGKILKNCGEKNSFMIPYVNSGRKDTYLVSGAIAAGVIGASALIQPYVPKLVWTSPMMFSTYIHTKEAIRNSGLEFKIVEKNNGDSLGVDVSRNYVGFSFKF